MVTYRFLQLFVHAEKIPAVRSTTAFWQSTQASLFGPLSIPFVSGRQPRSRKSGKQDRTCHDDQHSKPLKRAIKRRLHDHASIYTIGGSGWLVNRIVKIRMRLAGVPCGPCGMTGMTGMTGQGRTSGAASGKMHDDGTKGTRRRNQTNTDVQWIGMHNRSPPRLRLMHRSSWLSRLPCNREPRQVKTHPGSRYQAKTGSGARNRRTQSARPAN
ncbi:hypothetical protein LX32DRAFT_403157 [Colletotrichum zoysiae]|uniref:Uncharacterized protein n=1 Tax=Colletotrichum zoysiae TaxID=1216348 RepID=A0AAD9HG95_9PEZI|nr:hypothetical protein LX32DRAFT_403157 [Colletotrichum zoysiae]